VQAAAQRAQQQQQAQRLKASHPDKIKPKFSKVSPWVILYSKLTRELACGNFFFSIFGEISHGSCTSIFLMGTVALYRVRSTGLR